MPSPPIASGFSLRPLLTVLAILVQTLALDIIGIILILLVRPWNRALYRSLMGRSALARWQEAAAYLFPKVRYVIHGDPIVPYAAHGLPPHEQHQQSVNVGDREWTNGTPPQAVGPLALLIANHQVDMDWLYVWEVARVYSAHPSIKVVLKDTLKYIPVLGFAMSLLEFLFLKRNWESDRDNLYQLLGSFAKDKVPVSLVLFPEGTTVHSEAIEKSQKFGREKNRPHLDLLLLPRSTGFEACLKAMSPCQPVVYDLTICFGGYTGEIPTFQMGYERNRDKDIPNLSKLLMGHKAEVHVDVRAITYAEVLQYPTAEEFLDARWVRKERLMKYFAEHQKFPEEVGPAKTLVAEGVQQSFIELWVVVALSVILLPFALMMSIPYALIVTITYSYIKWHEYTRGMLSREDKQLDRETVIATVFKYCAVLFLIGTVIAWLYTTYSLLSSIWLYFFA